MFMYYEIMYSCEKERGERESESERSRRVGRMRERERDTIVCWASTTAVSMCLI
jgi:hypothetical protein